MPGLSSSLAVLLVAALVVAPGPAGATGAQPSTDPKLVHNWVRAVQEGDRVLSGRLPPWDAEPFYRQALNLVREDPSLGPVIESLVLDRLGQAQAAQGKNDAAELSYLRSLVLRLGTEEQGAATAETLENLADLYYQRNQPEAGLRALRQSLAVRERSFGPRSPEAAQSLSLLGTAYRQLGRFEEAEQLLRRAGAILREAPQDACVREELSLAWNSLAELLAATGRDDEAERLRQEALRVLQPADCPPSLGEDPASLAPSRTATRAPPATRRRTP